MTEDRDATCRDTLDGLLRFLMAECPAYLELADGYRVVDLVADLAQIALVETDPTITKQ